YAFAMGDPGSRCHKGKIGNKKTLSELALNYGLLEKKAIVRGLRLGCALTNVASGATSQSLGLYSCFLTATRPTLEPQGLSAFPGARNSASVPLSPRRCPWHSRGR